MADKPLNSGLLWALTDDALESLSQMIESGLDFDVAFAILEVEWAEEDLYVLPQEDETA